MAKITNNKIIWGADDWLGGTDQYSATATTYYSTKVNNSSLMYAYNIDPYRSLGYITVGRDNVSVPTPTAIESYIRSSDTLSFTATAVGTYEIGITANPTAVANKCKLIQFNATDTITLGDYPYTNSGHAGHTEPLGYDVAVYYANVAGTNRRCLFYSWSDTTDWDIGRVIARVDSDDQAMDDDFMSTVAASPLAGAYLTGGASTEHPMIVGTDDVLYVGSGRYLHGYDGSVGNDGTFYPAILTLPSGYTMTSMLKYGEYLLLFAHNSASSYDFTKQAESTVFFWDYLSLDPSYIVDLQDNMCSQSFLYEGKPCVFTAGNYRDTVNTAYTTRIKTFDTQTSITLVDVPGQLPCRGGVSVTDKQIIWNTQGVVYTLGNNLGMPIVVNKLSDLAASNNGLCTTRTGVLMVSSGATTVGGLDIISATKYQADGRLVTKTIEPLFTNDKKGRVKSVTVRYGDIESTPGRKVDIRLRYNRGASVVTLATNDYPATATELVKNFEHDTSGNPLPNFTDLALDILWKSGTDNTDAPLISSVEVEYETINI